MTTILTTRTKEWGETNDGSPVVTDQQEQHVVDNDDSSSSEEEAAVNDSVQVDDPSIDLVETVINDDDDEPDVIDDDPPVQPERPKGNQRGNNPMPAAVHKLQDDLNSSHWDRGMIGSVLHKHCIGSVIREYNNFESVSVSAKTQYGFQKVIKLFKDEGYKATVKELSKNLIGKNVIDMLPGNSVTSVMMKMSLSYLIFLKKKEKLGSKS